MGFFVLFFRSATQNSLEAGYYESINVDSMPSTREEAAKRFKTKTVYITVDFHDLDNKTGQATRTEYYYAASNEYIVGLVSSSGGTGAGIGGGGSYAYGTAFGDHGEKTVSVTFTYLDLAG